MRRETGTSLLRVIAVGLGGTAVVALAVACSFIVDFNVPADAGTDEPTSCERDSDCDDDNDCTDDVCTDGECVSTNSEEDTACDEFVCRTDETCDGDGHCDPDSGTELSCDSDDNPCTADVCTEDHGGCYPPEPEGTDCEGTFFCRDGETCDGAGACDEDSGTAHDCADDNPCTVGNCNEDADECGSTAAAEGTSCEGYFFCRDGETCDAEGNCAPSSGTEIDCADAFSCTDDACSEDTDACTHLVNHALCTTEGRNWCDPEDGDADADGCTEGKPCPGGTDAECSDGQFCNGDETCSASGRCEAGTAPVCDDGATCTNADRCDPAGAGGDGACTFPVDHGECDDSLVCTTDTCDPSDTGADATTGCVFTAVTCSDDGNLCTQDACTEAHGGCYPPEAAGTSCEGTFACRDAEVCDAAGTCLETSGTAVTCTDDGNLCTTEACTEPAGCASTAVSDGTSCEGTFACRTGEVCDAAGACLDTSGTAVTCTDDGNPCTSETCSESFGGCHEPEAAGTSCEGTFDCRTAEVCDAAGACLETSGTAVTCTDDGNPCTQEICDETFGGCHPPEPIGTACSVTCYTGTTCDASGVCDPATGTEITTCTDDDGCCPVATGCCNELLVTCTDSGLYDNDCPDD